MTRYKILELAGNLGLLSPTPLFCREKTEVQKGQMICLGSLSLYVAEWKLDSVSTNFPPNPLGTITAPPSSPKGNQGTLHSRHGFESHFKNPNSGPLSRVVQVGRCTSLAGASHSRRL